MLVRCAGFCLPACLVGVVILLILRNQRACIRSKDWRCRARVTPARLPWRAHVACVPLLRLRHSFSRMQLSQKSKTSRITSPLALWLWLCASNHCPGCVVLRVVDPDAAASAILSAPEAPAPAEPAASVDPLAALSQDPAILQAGPPGPFMGYPYAAPMMFHNPPMPFMPHPGGPMMMPAPVMPFGWAPPGIMAQFAGPLPGQPPLPPYAPPSGPPRGQPRTAVRVPNHYPRPIWASAPRPDVPSPVVSEASPTRTRPSCTLCLFSIVLVYQLCAIAVLIACCIQVSGCAHLFQWSFAWA
jgi:hypothetical protein